MASRPVDRMLEEIGITLTSAVDSAAKPSGGNDDEIRDASADGGRRVAAHGSPTVRIRFPPPASLVRSTSVPANPDLHRERSGCLPGRATGLSIHGAAIMDVSDNSRRP